MSLDQQVDQSSFATTQTVQDDGNGSTNTTTIYSNSIVLMASYMLIMVIFAMF